MLRNSSFTSPSRYFAAFASRTLSNCRNINETQYEEKLVNSYLDSTHSTPSRCYLPFSPFLHCAWDSSSVVIVISVSWSAIIRQILALPADLCADKSLPYCLLNHLQVNLGIVWQDAAVHFDPPLSV